jgi:hypothetical protein
MAMTENGGGKERKINGGPPTANQVRDGWKDLKQKCSQTESAIKNVLSRILSKERSNRYLRFLEIMYSHSVPARFRVLYIRQRLELT